MTILLVDRLTIFARRKRVLTYRMLLAGSLGIRTVKGRLMLPPKMSTPLWAKINFTLLGSIPESPFTLGLYSHSHSPLQRKGRISLDNLQDIMLIHKTDNVTLTELDEQIVTGTQYALGRQMYAEDWQQM